MLKNPQLKNDQFLQFLDSVMNPGVEETALREGVILTPSFSLGNRINNIKNEYPKLENDISAYGVCDSLEQLLEKIPSIIKDPIRNFCISITEVRKEKQSREGGWRWHKWGEYIGIKEPRCEYLHDEDDSIQNIFCYHVYELQD